MVYFQEQSDHTLKTERVLLEPILVSHAAKLFTSFQDDRLCFIHRPASVLELEARYRKFETHGPGNGKAVWLNWAARSRDTAEYIGWFQASIYDDQTAELAYVLFPAFWRKGYATECCTRIMHHLHDVYATTLFIAEMSCENVRSIALAERLGFTRVEAGASSGEFRYELILGE